VHALLMGGHGDDMVPLTRYTFAGGSPSRSSIKPSVSTRSSSAPANGGAEIVKLLKTGSAYYAPAAATVAMAESIIRDKKRILPCAAYCEKEYGVGGFFVGVPCILGSEGVERVIEVELERRGTQDVPEQRRPREGAGEGCEDVTERAGQVCRQLRGVANAFRCRRRCAQRSSSDRTSSV
jgi:malate/lactate dehydrogenase